MNQHELMFTQRAIQRFSHLNKTHWTSWFLPEGELTIPRPLREHVSQRLFQIIAWISHGRRRSWQIANVKSINLLMDRVNRQSQTNKRIARKDNKENSPSAQDRRKQGRQRTKIGKER